MRNDLTTSDIFDVNKKTGGLILGKNRLDDYASKYLRRVCREALTTPMPLPIEQILADEHLTVEDVSLSRNLDIFGCCLLLNGEVQVYDQKTGCMKPQNFPAGTILIDPDYIERYGIGAKRNTLIHEALHWEKDKRYFEILQIKNRAASEKLYPIMCRQSETYYEPSAGKNTKENEVHWLEWQAHRLAPRVLMPHDMFKKKALEIIEHPEDNDALPLSCDTLIECLSSFFLVSRSSAKYRLIEVGLEAVIAQFGDYADVYAEILEHKDYQQLTPVEAFSLAAEDSLLGEWISSGSFIYADGYFVLANPKFVTLKAGVPQLTTAAKKNLQRCVLNIREQRFANYTYACKDLEGLCYLYKTNVQAQDSDKRIYLFDPKLQTNIEEIVPDAKTYAAALESLPAYDEDEENQLLGMLAMPNNTLCQCLWFLMENRHWTAPSTFTENTGLHANYHGKIRNNDYNNMGTGILMAICVGMKLRLCLIEKIFDKSEQKLNRFQDPDKTYYRILERFPGIPLNDFNGMLKAANLPELGTKEKVS